MATYDLEHVQCNHKNLMVCQTHPVKFAVYETQLYNVIAATTQKK